MSENDWPLDKLVLPIEQKKNYPLKVAVKTRNTTKNNTITNRCYTINIKLPFFLTCKAPTYKLDLLHCDLFVHVFHEVQKFPWTKRC